MAMNLRMKAEKPRKFRYFPLPFRCSLTMGENNKKRNIFPGKLPNVKIFSHAKRKLKLKV